MQQVDDLYIVGKVGNPVAAPSPNSVLEEEAMASWSWDSTMASSSSQHGSPLQGSPLQSSSSQSVEARNQASSVPKTLVETLQTCLTSMPQSTTAGASGLSSATSPPTHAPDAARPPAQNSGAASRGAKGLGPTKPAKRRSRASRRVPTTVLEASCDDFRDMVQRLTGIPAAAVAAAAPKGDLGGHVVRPQPKRATPGTGNTLDRPEPQLPAIQAAAPSQYNLHHPLHPALNSEPRTFAHNSIDAAEFSGLSFLQQLQRSTSAQGSQFPSISCKAEGLPTSRPFASNHAELQASAAAPITNPSIWDEINAESRNFTAAPPLSAPMPSSWDAVNERSRTLGYTMASRHNNLPDDKVGVDVLRQFSGVPESSTHNAQISPEDLLSFSQIDSWLHVDPSAEMRA